MIIIILLGHNVFFSMKSGAPISIISDNSFGKRFYFTNSPNSPYVVFPPNVNISIKEVRLYTFEKKKSIYQDQKHHSNVEKRNLSSIKADMLHKGKDFYV